MEANPFSEWLAEVTADAIVVHPDDIVAEARGNLWTFGLSAEQREAVHPAEVEGFVREVAATRGRWLAERGSGPMRFYCWYDAQAGQLRISLVSVASGPLPFGCPVEPVSVLRTIVQEFLIPTEVSPPKLLVWVVVVPPDAGGKPIS